MRSLAVVVCVFAGSIAAAQPSGGGDIDMDSDGSGSGSGSAQAQTPPPDAGSGSAVSDAPVKDPKVAKKWLSAAQQLVQKGDYFTNRKKPDDAKAQYQNAVTAYQKAIEAGDDITVNLALGTIEDKLGTDVDAYKHVKLVVDAQPPVKPDVLKKAQAKLDEIAAKIGTLTLTVTPEGTTVTLSGTSLGDAPIKDPIILMPGDYTASFALVGYQPKELQIKIEAGGGVEKKVDLEPVPIKATPHTYEPEPEPAPIANNPSKTPLIIGLSATGVFAAAAVVTGISAISQHNAYTSPIFTPSERKDAQSLGKTMAYLNDAAIGLAVVSAAFTVYWYQWHYKPERDAPPPGSQPRVVPKVDMVPWVQPDAGGLAAVGSF
ncbi:MAG: PEGA domain-containing protein [Kofleriaceae bacterium]